MLSRLCPSPHSHSHDMSLYSMPSSAPQALAAALLVSTAVMQTAGPASARPTQQMDRPLLSAAATLTPTKGNEGVSGSIIIREAYNKRGRQFTEVVVDVQGLKPGLHALSINRNPASASCDAGACLGEVWNPAGLPHGKPDAVKKFGASASHYAGPPKPAAPPSVPLLVCPISRCSACGAGDGSLAWRHVGDLGNIKADAQGVAKATFEEPVVALEGDTNVLGRSIALHVNADDFSQPDGNVGPILAYGTLAAQ